MIKFISKIFKFLFTLFVAFIIFAYLFSLKSNMSLGSTISYFKDIIYDLFDIENTPTVDVPNEIVVTLRDNNYYYYYQLSDNSQIIYSALENNIDNLKKENYSIDFGTAFNDLLNTTTGQFKLNKDFQSALDAFFYDHPELFYLDTSNFSLNTKCISFASLKTYTVTIIPKNGSYLSSNFNSEQDVNDAVNKLENEKRNIINTINTNSNVYTKLKQVHDTLVNTLEYDETQGKANTHNVYGALVEKKVVCEGYAKAFKYILDDLGIECILVNGLATTSSGKEELHMWNYVKLSDEWYGVDVTWDDPIIIGGYSKNNLRHDYFLKGQKSFLVSHNSSGKISDTGMLFTVPTLSNKNYKTSSK